MNEQILIADDHGIVRMGLSMMIHKIRPGTLITEAIDYVSVIELAKNNNYNLFILDVSMPNGSFLNTFAVLKQLHPNCKILVFSSLDEEIYAMRYIESGVDGFLNKLATEDEIKTALQKIFNNSIYVSEAVKDALVSSKSARGKSSKSQLELLSNREISIADMLVKGYSLKHISNELTIHVSTVSTYKTRIFEKLKIHTIPDLIKILDQNN